MQALPITPLSDIVAAVDEASHGAARIPQIDFDAMVEEFESIHAELDDANDDKTGEFAAAATTGTTDADDTADADEAAIETGVRPAPEGDTDESTEDEWLSAAQAADELDVSVRHLRRLATAGKVQRKRESGKSVYCINPWLEAQARAAQPATDNPVTGAGTTPETRRASEPSEEEVTGAIEVSKVAAAPESDEDEVIELEASDVLDAGPGADVVAEELVATNRELMRLVEGMLGRWHEVHTDQGRIHGELRGHMSQAMELQQCLASWQHHASTLERQLLQVNHIATRALDVADEALATRWTSGRRRRELRERLDGLRGDVG